MNFFLTTFVFIFSLTAFAESKLALMVELNPAGSFQATSEKVKGNIVKNKDGTIHAGILSVNIKTLKTGIDLRDEHLWKHLNAEQHPKVTLTDIKGKDGKATGTLEVSGKKLPIDITYSEQDGSINAKFKVKCSSYKLAKAQYLGVGVEDLVIGEATLPFKSI